MQQHSRSDRHDVRERPRSVKRGDVRIPYMPKLRLVDLRMPDDWPLQERRVFTGGDKTPGRRVYPSVAAKAFCWRRRAIELQPGMQRPSDGLVARPFVFFIRVHSRLDS